MSPVSGCTMSGAALDASAAAQSTLLAPTLPLQSPRTPLQPHNLEVHSPTLKLQSPDFTLNSPILTIESSPSDNPLSPNSSDLNNSSSVVTSSTFNASDSWMLPPLSSSDQAKYGTATIEPPNHSSSDCNDLDTNKESMNLIGVVDSYESRYSNGFYIRAGESAFSSSKYYNTISSSTQELQPVNTYHAVDAAYTDCGEDRILYSLL